jgi:glucan 1,3-beta-glucosidase
VSVRDFGAAGDGITDDTAAINRAIQQIYSASYNDTSTKVRRTIYFPAGTYVVTTPILVPPYASLHGDGRENTILAGSNVSAPVLKTTDSQFSGAGSTLSRDVFIDNMGVQQTGNASLITSSALVLDGTRAARIVNVSFRGNTSTGATTNNLVYITDSVQSARSITLEQCSFTYAGSGVNIVVQGSGISSVRLDNCYFNNLSNVAYFVSNAATGVTTLNNYYGTVGAVRKLGINGNLTSFGGIVGTTPTGLILGQQQTNTTQIISVPTSTTTVITTLANGAGSFDYQLDNGALYRFGTFKYTNTGSAVTFEDDYTETGAGLTANLFANATGSLSISTGTAATLKYNLRQYLS